MSIMFNLISAPNGTIFPLCNYTFQCNSDLAALLDDVDPFSNMDRDWYVVN